jgi:hypothetical protein
VEKLIPLCIGPANRPILFTSTKRRASSPPTVPIAVAAGRRQPRVPPHLCTPAVEPSRRSPHSCWNPHRAPRSRVPTVELSYANARHRLAPPPSAATRPLSLRAGQATSSPTSRLVEVGLRDSQFPPADDERG